MKRALFTLAGLLAALACHPGAQAAGEPPIQRLALCQDTWLDWQEGDPRMAQLVRHFDSQFDRSGNDGAFTPKSPLKVMGHAVTHVYPQSVGMGVGFSLVIQAGFSQARAGIEKQLGQPMTCSTSDGVRSCELKLAPKKTALLMTGQNGQAPTSVIGCYYFYQQ